MEIISILTNIKIEFEKKKTIIIKEYLNKVKNI